MGAKAYREALRAQGNSAVARAKLTKTLSLV
jgi:hypothetical protein